MMTHYRNFYIAKLSANALGTEITNNKDGYDLQLLHTDLFIPRLLVR